METKLNLLKGDVRRQIIFFAVPMVAAQMCQQLYQMTDTIIVGRFIGEESLAAVGACAPFVFLFIALAKGIGMGASIVVSQNYGRGNYENVRKTSESIYIFMALLSVIMTALGLVFRKEIMHLINLPEELVPIAVRYFSVYLFGLVFLFLFNSVTGLLRGVGDSVTPLKFIILSVVLNIGLDLLFIVGFGWDVEGAAWATVLAQALAVLATFAYTNVKNPMVGLRPLKARIHGKLFVESIKLGIPSGIQQVLVSIGMIAIMTVINKFGVNVIAGYVAASRIEMFVMVVPMNIALALTSFVAQNYGAGQIDRVEKGIKESLRISVVVCFVVLMLLSVTGRYLMLLFTENEEIIRVGEQYLFIIGITFILFSVMFVYTGAMRGVGNTVFPMFTTMISLWLFKVPAANVLSGMIGETGIWLASPISWLLGMIMIMVYWYCFQLKKIRKV